MREKLRNTTANKPWEGDETDERRTVRKLEAALLLRLGDSCFFSAAEALRSAKTQQRTDASVAAMASSEVHQIPGCASHHGLRIIDTACVRMGDMTRPQPGGRKQPCLRFRSVAMLACLSPALATTEPFCMDRIVHVLAATPASCPVASTRWPRLTARPALLLICCSRLRACAWSGAGTRRAASGSSRSSRGRAAAASTATSRPRSTAAASWATWSRCRCSRTVCRGGAPRTRTRGSQSMSTAAPPPRDAPPTAG